MIRNPRPNFKFLEEQKNTLTEEKKDLVKRISELKLQIDEWSEKAELFKQELVEKETKLIITSMDYNELQSQNETYKKKINSQSMADLGGKRAP